MTRYEGTCDVCLQPIALDHDPESGVIDIGVEEDGSVYTWIRHGGGPQEGCGLYFSVVRKVPDA